ncbi:protease inhibitor I42 family protein [Eubacteriales bacterium OttesenSCG-928-N13]|nr:protease inhibitor I42 family protein [Eubacteriales bacterium OttesenSCG-928-N13]
MKKLLALMIALMLLICAASVSLAEADTASEGFTITDAGIDISLWENGSTGYAWDYSLDDEALLSFVSDRTEAAMPEADNTMVGAPVIHTWSFAASGDGEVLLTFFYERPWADGEEDTSESLDDEEPTRVMNYILQVAGGKVTNCELENLSDDYTDGDFDSVTTFKGETGGVPLEVFADMTESQTDEGTLLSNDDGSTKILIQYEPNDDPAELFEKLKDTESAGAIYNNEQEGIAVISCMLDTTSDVKSVTLIYSIPEGIEEYTGYQAPNGGVLHVHTTYLLDTGAEDDYMGEEEDWSDWDDAEEDEIPVDEDAAG